MSANLAVLREASMKKFTALDTKQVHNGETPCTDVSHCGEHSTWKGGGVETAGMIAAAAAAAAAAALAGSGCTAMGLIMCSMV